ncbi:hypothetical protein H7J07_05790 [Mycobacterium koreense]|uniref:Uncharacterized protein n=1 Tax=Mycolicibacillus koreensis TaxID=1069220 RepID=A0A7I7SCL2_9MYCO|nr:hypothetical protein [Mycolicibacillus koreensis]MCV7247737.1 hypothetical protein [Mycolicibacillus koreensis]OSC34738.1 hypothetical protein B8W67_05675 [Mycolicibacillus koreensis]BBY54121.1 hypothetical protein MKOR_13720 [Mycolicibacillus koreensis]
MAGKYASARDEKLHTLVLDGMAADTVGDVSTWGHIYDGIADLDADEVARLGLTGDVPAGKWWIVCENSDGFIDVDEFDTAEQYADAIRSLEADYAEFEGS